MFIINNMLIDIHIIGENYIIDKLRVDTDIIKLVDNLSLSMLYTKYINRKYLYYLLNTSNNYTNVYKIVKKLIYYRHKYNLFLGKRCELCFKNSVYNPKHSINNNNLCIYIEPALASDYTVYYICQHLLMSFDLVINVFVTNLLHPKKITMIFNMRDNTYSMQNIKIATAMYNIISDCYINDIEYIKVSNFGSFMKLFTKLFSITFNNKIIVE
jgi:hypothetical protein